VKSEPQSDGGVILRIPYKHEPELVMDILRHGQNVEVLGPVSLRKTVGEALAAAADKYTGR
jgi:predicted DNA-binding transcriptional regulator YafY